MKIEIAENEVRLIPENQFERDALTILKNGGVNEIEFEDNWNSSGHLKLKQSSPYDWGS